MRPDLTRHACPAGDHQRYDDGIQTRVTLSVNFPNMLKFSIVNSRTKFDIDVLASAGMENKSVTELFGDFYRLQNNGQDPSEAHERVLDKVLRELEETK